MQQTIAIWISETVYTRLNSIWPRIVYLGRRRAVHVCIEYHGGIYVKTERSGMMKNAMQECEFENSVCYTYEYFICRCELREFEWKWKQSETNWAYWERQFEGHQMHKQMQNLALETRTQLSNLGKSWRMHINHVIYRHCYNTKSCLHSQYDRRKEQFQGWFKTRGCSNPRPCRNGSIARSVSVPVPVLFYVINLHVFPSFSSRCVSYESCEAANGRPSVRWENLSNR